MLESMSAGPSTIGPNFDGDLGAKGDMVDVNQS
jgi:hypothetical protein